MMAAQEDDGDGLMGRDELVVRAWLRKQGFQKGDLRTMIQIYETYWTFPMLLACQMGELHVCRWLFDHGGAAEDITRMDNQEQTPMLLACEGGHLAVCKWLYEVGAADDICRCDEDGRSPIYCACSGGHLAICKWLYEVGLEQDAMTVWSGGAGDSTLLFQACLAGHLSICEWLHEVASAGGCEWIDEAGLREDLTAATPDGRTPMRVACGAGHLSVCQWLTLNGALNDPSTDHVDRGIVLMETRRARKPALLAWAQRVVADHRVLVAFLRGTLSTPQRPGSAHLWMLNEQGPAFSRMFKELIADFAWGRVETGRRLRNAREFAEALVEMGVQPLS